MGKWWAFLVVYGGLALVLIIGLMRPAQTNERGNLQTAHPNATGRALWRKMGIWRFRKSRA